MLKKKSTLFGCRTVRVAELLRNYLLIVYEDILISRNPGDGWCMRMQVLPGLLVRRPGFEASLYSALLSVRTVVN